MSLQIDFPVGKTGKPTKKASDPHLSMELDGDEETIERFLKFLGLKIAIDDDEADDDEESAQGVLFSLVR